MEYRIVHLDELYHYGVPGMRWGHRKGPVSLAGTGHRAMAGVYGINQRFYNRTGNKTLASMNANARNQALKKAAAADAAKVHKKAVSNGSKISKKNAEKNANISYKDTLKGKSAKLGAKAVGKSFKVNEAVERKKASAASKVGLKKLSQTYTNNADYYKQTSKDLQSGKVGKPQTRYQKAMQALGRSNFATKAIMNSKELNAQQKAAALAEQGLLREAHRQEKRRKRG